MNGFTTRRHNGRSNILRRLEGDVSPEPAVDGGDESANTPVYCDIVPSVASLDFTEPTAITEPTTLNAQYIVALAEEGPDQADELFGDTVELAARVGDIDPTTLEPVLELFPFDDPDDPDDPALDDLGAEAREDADDLIAFQSMSSAADPEIGEELEAILEVECADALASIEVRTVDGEE